ncbi:hypothetical protein C1645_782731 [Glomus cerebriforme]|uniref:Protein kinase domain-containing protein n=1 Tax=Glomus cerebriforme TaxID=658196 RepID=A0A397SK88_9GLOM|nr:hypothetical protein C1645_782731 [Glomus cerebriforme]
MIMWELMIGRKPFPDERHDACLIVEISAGLRPPIVTENVPEGYIKLMKECWHSDPNKRPTAIEIKKRIWNIFENEIKNPTKIIMSKDIGPIKSYNPGSIYISRPLSAESTRSLKFQSYVTKELEFDIYNKNNKNNYYITKEYDFDINL